MTTLEVVAAGAATTEPAPCTTSPAIDAPRAAGPSSVSWSARYRRLLVAVDLAAVVLAVALAYVTRLGLNHDGRSIPRLVAIASALTVGWLIALHANGGYEIKHLSTGPEEFKRVLRAGAVVIGVVAVAAYAAHTDLARAYVMFVIPFGIVLLMAGRTGVRALVRRRRSRGAWSHRILAVGTTEAVHHLLATTNRATNAGLIVVGACVEDSPVGTDLAPGVPVVGGVLEAAANAATVGADVVAVTGEGLGPVGVRELGWELEGTGRGLVMAPSLTEVAGTRVQVTPVEGLPLVWLDKPRLGRIPRITKRIVDIAGGLALLLVSLPVLLVTAVAIKLNSRGPVLYRQSRLGTHGEEFMCLKFRSMHVDAESRRAAILALNEQDGGGVLFKIKNDPRITGVGRWIRKFSIDELPQVFHVISGRMSLVGPRPLASEDSTYVGSARRRLLVRPGLTGLWQVSGRSDTSWDDAVRLDLYYVENWSLALDLSILFRTFLAVLARRGAY